MAVLCEGGDDGTDEDLRMSTGSVLMHGRCVVEILLLEVMAGGATLEMVVVEGA